MDPQVTPTKDELTTAASVTPTPKGRQTPPGIKDAIESISKYEYESPLDETEELAALMMLSSGNGNTEYPALRTKAWPYAGKKPNPISINKARKLLAAALSEIHCDVDGAGEHGHAWMVETEEVWLRRSGITATVTAPKKPVKGSDFSIKKQLEYNYALGPYKLYYHLSQAAKSKILEWFGEARFNDLFEDDLLPPTKTPNELFDHLAKTYSRSRDFRKHLEQIEEEFNSKYEPKQGVEAYFKKIQNARTDAELLGQPFTEKQAINKALKQFTMQYGKDAIKAETKWEDKPETEQNWAGFKEYWKNEIEQWDAYAGAARKANQAIVDDLTARMDSMQANMAALQAENRSVQEQNHALVAQQIQFRHALQAEERRRAGADDMSALTEALSGFDRRLNDIAAGFNASSSSGTPTTVDLSGRTSDRGDRTLEELLQSAKTRNPAAYKHLNDGKGKKFNKYCWRCGCNCTHSTGRCYELTEEQQRRYQNASFDDTMGGNTKFLERRGKWQADYGFDSL